MEEKTYSIVGTVTIGTDEYRDLIESVADAKADLKEESSKASERFWKIRELEDINKKLNERIAELDAFMSDRKLASDFKLWKIERDDDAD